MIRSQLSREKIVDMLEGHASESMAELHEFKTRQPLIKSYMLETVPEGQTEPNFERLFEKNGQSLRQVDDTWFAIHNSKTNEIWGYLELLMKRHPVVYTTEKSSEADPHIARVVHSSAKMDRLWMSGVAFQQLLQFVCDTYSPSRLGRIVFQHSSIYEGAPVQPDKSEDLEPSFLSETPEQQESGEVFVEEPDYRAPENRKTRFMMVDRLRAFTDKLPRMRSEYSPLHSISQLRVPAADRGGHDFFFNGKVTNRGDGFADHRNHISYVLECYKRSTEEIERIAWNEVEKVNIGNGPSVGSPVMIRFLEPLSRDVFDNFIRDAFEKRSSKFRLCGSPIRLGPTKVHVYGLDRHLWQPIDLEITHKQIVAIVPRGTCGNSIHRLITNVQQYLSPEVEATVGGTKYEEILRNQFLKGPHGAGLN